MKCVYAAFGLHQGVFSGGGAQGFHEPFKGVRTLTANIVIEMGYATDLHREALIATGVVLFVFILIINFCVALLNRGDKSRE